MKSKLVFVVSTILAFGLFTLLFFYFVKDYGPLPEKTEQRIVTNDIYSFQTTGTTTGSFVFGSGTVNGVVKYYVYVKKDGGMLLQNIDAESTILKEIDEKQEHPHYEEVYDVRIVPRKNGLNFFDPAPTKETDDSYEFWKLKQKTLYIPKNTVKQEFNTSLPK